MGYADRTPNITVGSTPPRVSRGVPILGSTDRHLAAVLANARSERGGRALRLGRKRPAINLTTHHHGRERHSSNAPGNFSCVRPRACPQRPPGLAPKRRFRLVRPSLRAPTDAQVAPGRHVTPLRKRGSSSFAPLSPKMREPESATRLPQQIWVGQPAAAFNARLDRNPWMDATSTAMFSRTFAAPVAQAQSLRRLKAQAHRGIDRLSDDRSASVFGCLTSFPNLFVVCPLCLVSFARADTPI